MSNSLRDFATDSERQALTELLAKRGATEADLDSLVRVDIGPQGYERVKERQAKISRAVALSGRDIGDIPPISNQARRDECAASFRRFCEVYLSARFTLDWSADHLRTIARIEEAILSGGLFALAMPRGSGKTTLCEAAAMWATMTGRRRYVLVIGATSDAAKKILLSIKTELDTNDVIAADWPDVTHPIRSLEGIANRAKGQLCGGKQTRIVWGSGHIVFAQIQECAASQAIIEVAGLTGSIRGRKHKTGDGETVRPDFVILDDPQTDKSARSAPDTDKRKAIVNGAVLGLAGPDKRIAGVMPCTVIRRGDLADDMLDREKSPHWHGERFKMLYSLPTNQSLWDEYWDILRGELASGGDGATATEFYAANREAMDAGAVPGWLQRKLPNELSAIQHAMNLKLRAPAAFDAEYQNEPADEIDDVALLSVEEIAAKQYPAPRGVVPVRCDQITGFIDVQDDALFWLVAAWAPGFSGHILDYGVYPQITRNAFTLRDLAGLLERTYPGKGQEARWLAAIRDLSLHLTNKEWRREDGALLRVGKLLVDSAYGRSTDTVYEAVRHVGSSVVGVSRGMFFGCSSTPMSDVKPKPGQTLGTHWRIDKVDKRQLRCVTIDTNWWKSFVHARLSTPLGDRGSLTLYQSQPYLHQTLAEHLRAEFRTRTQNKTSGREVDEWRAKPERPDNHWLDCLVGCAVAASMLGVSVEGTRQSPSSQRQKLSFSQMQAAARNRR